MCVYLKQVKAVLAAADENENPRRRTSTARGFAFPALGGKILAIGW